MMKINTIDFMEYCPSGIVLMDTKGNIQSINNRMKHILGFGESRYPITEKAEYETALLKKLDFFFNASNQYVRSVLKSSITIYHIKNSLEKIDGTLVNLSINMGPMMDQTAGLTGVVAAIEDITDQKFHEEEREKLVDQISDQYHELTELHTALETLIDHQKTELEQLQVNIAFNLRNRVVPYMEKIENSQLSQSTRIYFDIALSNLNDIFSSYGSGLHSNEYRLTPRELEVAELVRTNKSNKEMAEILHL